ncbi:ubiquitin domain-containing protein 7SL RNA2-like [Malania oleifera]|uniref:ubiquitin domain-containing protein 7SL RNA2-like n=1 Tax=Malania oleifera TaxID=397392 RepID=UPI0025ADBE41|nr:ubiquitin domain-containing protein 7SL RNA2-like [Malania oleifera]
MDVNFEPTKGKPFSIEVGFWDTVAEIKEKIQKNEGVPVAKQTLIFKEKVLEDSLEVISSDLTHNSLVKLIIEPAEPEKPAQPEKKKQKKVKESSSSSKKIQLHIRIKESNARISMAMEKKAKIGRLKERISRTEGVSFDRLVVLAEGVELQNHETLWDYGLSDGSELEVVVRGASAGSSTGSGGGAARGSKKLRVVVVTRCGTKRIPLDVYPWENVADIRPELEKQQEPLQFKLPEEGYFFIHNQTVMEEDQSFWWHLVKDGDIIDIFNGRVTVGVDPKMF